MIGKRLLEKFQQICADGLVGLALHPYLAKLNKLIEDYKSFDVCAEIYVTEVEYLIEKNQLAMAMQLCDEAIQLYLQLRTNERGEVAFSFTMPESLTC